MKGSPLELPGNGLKGADERGPTRIWFRVQPCWSTSAPSQC